MEYTNKLNLILPKGTDAYNIEDFNENFQKIDTASTTKPITTTAQDIDEFITSEEAQNIVSGETIIISGQIYMFMGGNSSDKDNYISYSGNSSEEIGNHVKNTQVHLTDAERTKWNTVDPHTKDKTMHITGAERTKWNTIDSALSITSTNAIQNKVIAEKIAAIETQNSGFESSLEGLNDSLNDGNLDFDFVAGDGLYYNVQVGADTVRKKCSGTIISFTLRAFSTNTSTITFDIKANYNNWMKLKLNNNIFIQFTHCVELGTSTSYHGMIFSYGYNNLTGIISITRNDNLFYYTSNDLASINVFIIE